ncbi:DUF368 domain-containing protein [Paenibacillus motobuensis]|uniref:DUF368 domain-containing protein n=1 Tax=Paenibacillus TaxID=44249 RepID=UPI00203ABF77|nr:MULTISPECIES: DUF368 domain-containing protein [Paenibacillus]MCM3039488.1 DUF368 domain-containing protein [Paenibacillus lutimineralis]MCM3646592.1 DUF368 domain-containing protein [Paenibacillus motobuensis]
MFTWSNIWRGMMIGTADLIPGVSGGTIAVILGFYDRLIQSISGFFSKEWKKHLGFLIPLGIGVVSALLILSRVMKWLLANHEQPTYFFFIGLILGIIPYLYKSADVKQNFKAIHYILFILAAIAIALTGLLVPADAHSHVAIELTFMYGVGLFGAGALASMAMLLPGISGSFVLLLIGVYPIAIEALSTFDLPLITIIGSGVIFGFILSSKLIKHLLATHPSIMYAIIIGTVIGSLYVIFPGMPTEIATLVISLFAMVLGLFCSLKLGNK